MQVKNMMVKTTNEENIFTGKTFYKTTVTDGVNRKVFTTQDIFMAVATERAIQDSIDKGYVSFDAEGNLVYGTKGDE